MNTIGINSFINKNYYVVFTGAGANESGLSNVREFLLADVGHNGCPVNSLFINTFATNEDVVMVERIPSMKEVAPDEAIQSVWLKTQAKIFGWDTDEVVEKMKSPLAMKLAREMIDLELKCEILLKQILESECDWHNETIRETLLKLGQRGIEVLHKSLMHDSEWVDSTIMSKFFNFIPSEKSKQQFKAISIMNVIKIFSTLVPKPKQETLAETVPNKFKQEKIKSMTDSLAKAGKIYNRTFLIADEKHLKNILKNSFIKPRNLVVLFPKSEAAEKMGEKRKSELEKLFSSVISEILLELE